MDIHTQRALSTPSRDSTRANAHETSARRIWMILLAAMLWGTADVSAQQLYRISHTNPLSIGFFRLAFATPALALVCWIRLGRASLRIARRDIARMMLVGFMLALYQVCYFAAIVFLGVAIATLVTLCIAPIIVALLSSVILGEQLTRPVGLALLLALAGIVCIVGFPARGTGALHLVNVPLGILLACCSAFGYAVVTLMSRALSSRYHALQINTVGFSTGALVLLPLALATGFVAQYPAQGWLLLVYMGIVPSALAYALFLMGMRSTPATVASILTLVEPMTATALAWIFFGERLGVFGFLGAALLVSAMVLLALRGAPKRVTLAS